MIFEERFVAFLDILGFSEIITKEVEIRRIVEIVKTETVNAKEPGSHGIFPDEKIKATYLSDSIVLSITTGEALNDAFKRLRYLLSAVERIQYRCALQDVWIRGGVSWGKLNHDENVVGEGLVKAYRLETTARFPRVLFDMSLISDFFEKKFDGPENRTQLLSEINMTWGAAEYSGKFLFDRTKLENPFHGMFQDDGLLFVHFMNAIYGEEAEVRQKLADSLRKRLYTATKPEIYAKYQWVVHYLMTIAPSDSAENDKFYSTLLSL